MNKPANQKLWDSLVVQAKAKFRKWPSIPASKWVHEQYTQEGGRFIEGSAKKRGDGGNEEQAPVSRPLTSRERAEASMSKKTKKDKKS